MNIAGEISSSVIKAVKELYGADITENMVQLQKTKREFEGSLTLVVFPFLKISRQKPEATAEAIGNWLVENCEHVERFNVVKGFLNLVLAQQSWIKLLNAISADEHYGERKAGADAPLVMIEYSSPNTNKPLHLGHVRNNLLDDTFALALQLIGHGHELMHKAVGWMLREAGKRDFARLRRFVDDHWREMPRTMLRYAIEKYPEAERKAVLGRRRVNS